jgi:hypothetical protein
VLLVQSNSGGSCRNVREEYACILTGSYAIPKSTAQPVKTAGERRELYRERVQRAVWTAGVSDGVDLCCLGLLVR